jgi:hypothetical protein
MYSALRLGNVFMLQNAIGAIDFSVTGTVPHFSLRSGYNSTKNKEVTLGLELDFSPGKGREGIKVHVRVRVKVGENVMVGVRV